MEEQLVTPNINDEIDKFKRPKRKIIFFSILLAILTTIFLISYVVFVPSRLDKQMNKSLEQVTREYPDFNVTEESESNCQFSFWCNDQSLNLYRFSLTHKKYKNVKLSVSAHFSDTSSSFSPDDRNRGGGNSLDQLFNTRINTGNYDDDFKDSFAQFINNELSGNTINLGFFNYKNNSFSYDIKKSYDDELKKVSNEFNDDWSNLYVILSNDMVVYYNENNNDWDIVYQGKPY